MKASQLNPPRCHVLRPGTPASAVTDLAAREGWELVSDAPRSNNRSAVRRWRVGGEADADAAEVELLDDHVAGYRLITVSESVSGLVAEALPGWGTEELFAQAQSADDPLTRMRALRALQYVQIVAAMNAAPQSPLDPDDPELRLITDDERFLTAFRGGLTDPVPGVRRAAVDGLGRTFYPGAQAILREHRDQLPDHAETIDWFLENGTFRIRAKDS